MFVQATMVVIGPILGTEIGMSLGCCWGDDSHGKYLLGLDRGEGEDAWPSDPMTAIPLEFISF